MAVNYGAWGNMSPKQRKAIAKRVAQNNRPATAKATVQGRHATPHKPALPRGGGSSAGKEVATRPGKSVVRAGGKDVAKTAAKRGLARAALTNPYTAIVAGSVAAGAYGVAEQKKKNKKGYYLTSGGIGASGYGTPKYEYRGDRTKKNSVVGNADGSTTAGKTNKVSGYKSPKGLSWRSEHNNWGSYTKYNAAPGAAHKTTGAKDKETRIYNAGPGASWGKISKETGVSVADLKKANPWQMKKRKGMIYRNSKIKVPGK